MDLTWDVASFASQVKNLPAELVQVLQHSSNTQLLHALSTAALQSHLTLPIFTFFEPLALELCARWADAEPAHIAASLGRIIHTLPYLSDVGQRILSRSGDLLESLNDEANIDPDKTRELLLAVYRLLHFDNAKFAVFVRPAKLQLLLHHEDRSIRCLAIRIICQYIHASNSTLEDIQERYLDDNPARGRWEEKDIDYEFLPLWEEKRLKDLGISLGSIRSARGSNEQHPQRIQRRIIQQADLHPLILEAGGILLLRSSSDTSTNRYQGSLISTPTTISNLHGIAKTVRDSNTILVTGLAGSGKSSLIMHLAVELGKASTMITLHLNEQSDAKLLIGVYKTGHHAGTFQWQPGVLTTAVIEGRWVFIEDLDRAPTEIISSLLPLIERGELLIPSRGEKLQAATGFKIIATIRSTLSLEGRVITPGFGRMLGKRHWNEVTIEQATSVELQDIIAHKYPILASYIPRIMATYDRLRSTPVNSSKLRARPVSSRELFKWAVRIHRILEIANVRIGDEPVPESALDSMFLDAIDCFVAHLEDSPSRDSFIAAIAEELHINPQRRDHLAKTRSVTLQKPRLAFGPTSTSFTKLRVGRATLTLPLSRHRSSVQAGDMFSHNGHSLRLLEQVAAAVSRKEPLLLVGETGIGKTTAIQQLAQLMEQNLVAINLSQQSESGDLLGGFKPVNMRSLVISIKDEFDVLFDEISRSREKNTDFFAQLTKSIAAGQWKRALALWKRGLHGIEKKLHSTQTQVSASGIEQKAKKQKTSLSVRRARAAAFSDKLAIFERQLSGPSNSFKFAFEEGKLVEAVREGYWVLLDEINLAPSDTLECLSDLLESGPDARPFLMLTEAGNVDQIKAHPDFRIFAAMNPASDVGKKDLPMGIRSRFTEVFVNSPDGDATSLQAIIKTYLSGLMESLVDKHLPVVIADMYQQIQLLVKEEGLVDGSGQRPHFSLRTLTRALSHARATAYQCNVRRAVFEGFCMCFFTALDPTSEAKVLDVVTTKLWADAKTTRAQLKKPMRAPAEPERFVEISIRIESLDRKKNAVTEKYWMPKGNDSTDDPDRYIVTPYVARNLRNLIRAASTRKHPVLIQGPTSAGKTSMVEYLAKRSGNRFVRINNHEHTDLQEYLGTYFSTDDGQLAFREGVLVQAVRAGHWIVLDELNLAPTDVLEALNRLLDDNRELFIPETQEVVKPHRDFMLFATQNPAGPYGGRKVLSRAFRNRFVELHFDDIPVEELNIILSRSSNLPPTWCEHIVEVYKRLSLLRQEQRIFEQNSFATLRDLFRWAFRGADSIEQLAANGYMLLAEKVRKDEERLGVKRIIEEAMSGKGVKIHIDDGSLYNATTCPEMDLYDTVDQSVIWTKSMRRLYTLVSYAIRHNEAVLLVGETGCGKTTVCQMLALAMKQQLHIINAHQNTETGDLIGSQRPIRNRAAIEQELISDLKIWRESYAEDDEPIVDLDALLARYDNQIALQDHAVPQQLQSSIELNRRRRKALFEWADGSLVHAMRAGHFYLLDEISLAEDSVLERMNSVLDPQRSLLLAEKGGDDALVTAQDGFQFLATMNPGGDYGKKELSPALRNRFTEIWVPSLSEAEDVLLITEVKLADSAKQFASPMIEFANWFGKRYNSHKTSSISIRDVLAWVQFVNNQKIDVIEAVIHGAALVYIDTLGANPSSLLAFDGRNLQSERSTCLETLSSFIGFSAADIYNRPIVVDLSTSLFQAGPFAIRRAANHATEDEFHFETPTVRQNTLRLLRALQVNKPILLEGNPGVGKTSIVTAVARAAGKGLVRINLSDQTDLMDLFGSDVPMENADAGNFAWRDAPFLQAMKRGDWVLLDEMNLASQAVLEGLNACLDHRGEVYISELDQTFSRHPDFKLFAAQNPHLQGGGRKGLPASFVNRFTVVYADVYQQDDLELICSRLFPSEAHSDLIMKSVSFVSRLEHEIVRQRRFGAKGAPWEFNLRDSLRWLQLLTSRTGLLPAGQAKDFLDVMFVQRFRSPSDVKQVRSLYNDTFGEAIENCSIFFNLSPKTVQVGLALLTRSGYINKVPPASGFEITLRLSIMQSLMLCVQQSWPVVLVGSSGVGKSSMLQALAHLVGADLEIFAMNSDIDATDLVGGYEQADAARNSQAHVQKLRYFCREELAKFTISKHSLADMKATKHLLAILEIPTYIHDWEQIVSELASYATLTESEVASSILDQCQRFASAPDSVEMARFEWVDGILVQALEKGRWLVLDNANLCSSSVLDRLNSLLEPNGTLIINEHCTRNGTAKVVKPHPNFRIFMTMDPQYGEMSRAMRNRAVELFLPPIELTGKKLHSTSAEARMVRLRRSIDFNPDVFFTQSPSIPSYFLPPVAGAVLTFADVGLLPRFVNEIRSGLAPVSTFTFLHTVLENYQKTFLIDPSWFDISSTMLKAITTRLQAPRDLALHQPIHPLSNPQLAKLVADDASSFNFSWLGTLLDILQDLAQMSLKLDLIRKHPQKLASEATRLERSLAVGRISNASKDSTRQVGPFLINTCGTISDWLKAQQRDTYADMNFAGFIQDFIHFWHSLLDVVNREPFEEAAFQTLVSLGRDHLLVVTTDTEIARQTLDRFRKQFNIFAAPTLLSTGLSMEVMWKAYRPLVARSESHFEAMRRLEALALRYDRIIWEMRIPIEQLVSVRTHLVESIRIAHQQDVNVESLVQDVEAVMETFTNQAKITTSIKPLLQPICEGICRLHELANVNDPEVPSPDEIIDLLACRSSFAQVNVPETQYGDSLARVSRLYATTISTQGRPLYLDRLSLGLLQQCILFSSVNLGSLELFQFELTAVAKQISNDSNLLCSHQSTVLLSALNRLIVDMETIHTENPALSDSMVARMMTQIAKVRQHLGQQARTAPESNLWKTLGDGFVEFARICLLLYVPDRSVDPALKSKMQRLLHEDNRTTLVAAIEALSQCEISFPGTSTTNRRLLGEIRIRDLGVLPDALQVARPPVSRLDELQIEFGNVIRIAKSLAPGNVPNRPGLDFALLPRLDIIERRLKDDFKEYADIVDPVVYFLRLLRMGFVLVERAQIPDGPVLPVSLSSSDVEEIPFSGIPLKAVKATRTSISNLYIEHVKLRASLEPPQIWRGDLVAMLQNEFDRLHGYWQMQLDKDQDKQKANTSLYQYKGDYAHDEDALERQFEELFPSFEEDSDGAIGNMSTGTSSKWDPQAASVYAADLHMGIFLSPGNAEDLLKNTIKSVAVAMSEMENAPNAAAKPNQTLPALFLLLREKHEQILTPDKPIRSYNIYTDTNIAEVKRLTTLIYEVQDRFRAILEAWPEHSTLYSVLASCNELLGVKHTEPLMKILIKVEQLHANVHEWQSVASREFSAISVYDKITQIIISWRQLELSTWAKLLDLETTKSDNEAKSFWFLAYGNVHLPDMVNHSAGLLNSLETLLIDSTLGQFLQRLQMLRSLQAQLKLSEDPIIRTSMADGIENLCNHFARFIPSVQEAISKQRLVLEKAVKDVVQLAVWKDTNIHALKQSAKTSHRKLFRIVKKYRDTLGRPVAPFLRQDAVSTSKTASDSLAFQVTGSRVLLNVLESLQASTTWTARPARFRNVEATVSMIEQKLSFDEDIMAGANRLEDFLDTLEATTMHLQKATPATLTEENAATSKHLTMRKRRLFADTLKDLRQMGFTSNPTADTLSRQSSLSTILSLMNALPGASTTQSAIQNAQSYLQGALDIMLAVRLASKEHHEDLNGQEVARCIGIFESVLAVSLHQRNILSRSLKAISTLDRVAGQVDSIWGSEGCQLLPGGDTDDMHDKQSLLSKLNWLPTILRVGATIISAQSSLGGLGFDDLCAELRMRADSIGELCVQVKAIPESPKGLINTAYRDWMRAAKETLGSLLQSIESWIEIFPLAKVTLEHILPWSRAPAKAATQAEINGLTSSDLDTVEHTHFHVFDMILGAAQDVEKHVEAAKDSDNSKNWLMDSMRLQEVMLKSLHLDRIVPALSHLLDQLHSTATQNPENFRLACASLALAASLIQAYQKAVYKTVSRYATLHNTTCRASYRLGKSFIVLSTQGFCKPAEKSGEKGGSNDKLESGTGLGEGEGADDISKDIGDDEDLTELAEDPQNQKKDGEIENEDDAVAVDGALEGTAGEDTEGKEDMDDKSQAGEDSGKEEELESETGSIGDGEGGQEDQEKGAGEEDVGEVDDLGPSAIDEKMWDQAGDESKKEKEGQQSASNEQGDDNAVTADESKKTKEQGADTDQQMDIEEGSEEDESDEEMGELDQDTQGGQDESMDPHVKDSEGLELPEELKLDGGKDDENELGPESLSDEDDPLSDFDTLDETERKAKGEDEYEPEDSTDKPQPGEADQEENGSDVTSMDADDDGDKDHDTMDYSKDELTGQDQDGTGGTADPDVGDDTIDNNQDADARRVGPEDTMDDQPRATSSAQRESGAESQANQKTQASRTDNKQSHPEPASQANKDQQAVKKLGDVLEKWHRQHREIKESSVEERQDANEDVDMADADFEHLPDNEATADTQALGASTEEQAKALNDGMAPEEDDQQNQVLPDEILPDLKTQDEDVEMTEDPSASAQDSETTTEAIRQPQAFVGERKDHAIDGINEEAHQDLIDESEEELDDELTHMSLLTRPPSPSPSPEDPHALWQHYTHATQVLAQTLTEQLRLILAPTLATKLRGDFRTGKRLNIKRIIPYVASSYKRDKIWMRRSVPSKRAYQVMLAIDDSGSMGERIISNPGPKDVLPHTQQDQKMTRASLALTTLALLTTSLNVLEVGSISVVGFGSSPFIAHDFSSPFISESGPSIISQFTFKQCQTNVKKLLEVAIDRFSDARTAGSSSGTEELWQLMLIISDGICEDHEGVRKLLVKAREERILVVFVVVDSSTAKEQGAASIVDLETVEFVQVPGELEGAEREMRIVRTKYLETFPFAYYLIVKDVQELPGVLATALRQWFAEVADR